MRPLLGARLARAVAWVCDSGYIARCPVTASSARRVIAMILLTLAPAATAESLLGALSDVTAHQKSQAAAAAHQDSGTQVPGRGTQGRQGHDSVPPTHQQGTPADHCTHMHGVAIVAASSQISFAVPVSVGSQLEPLIRMGWSPDGDFPPPRA